ADLVQVIGATKNQKLQIELLRAGKSQTIEATLAKRPEKAKDSAAEGAAGDVETMQKWIEQMWPNGEANGNRPPIRFRFFHPGAIVPPNAAAPSPAQL